MCARRRDERGWRTCPLVFDLQGTAGPITLMHQYHKPPPVDSAHPPPGPPPPGPPCPCAVFRLADSSWKTLTPAQQQAWNNAVKKPGRSGYMLWMKESMVCMFQHGLFPQLDNPSPSGGFSTIALNPDNELPCPPIIGAAPPPTPPPPPEPPFDTCWKCDPPLPAKLYVTVQGFKYDYSCANNLGADRHVLNWRAPCSWGCYNLPLCPPGSSIFLRWGTTLELWLIHLVLYRYCSFSLVLESGWDFCVRDGCPFTFYHCVDEYCAHPRSCIDSIATAKMTVWRDP